VQAIAIKKNKKAQIAELLRQVQNAELTDESSKDRTLLRAKERKLIFYSATGCWQLTPAGKRKLKQLKQRGYLEAP